ncbi:MAG: hypothetical protein IT258_00240 [Saprospiraceae bacterium]|nr:hypothetical protein [Saprospiraceae bacterium]
MVNAVRHNNELREAEFGTNMVEAISGHRVKDLVTKFFYRNSNLCFHILLHVDGGDTVLFREFTEYAEYRKAFSELQQAKFNNMIINIPKKNMALSNMI